jgi:hypothetical protein
VYRQARDKCVGNAFGQPQAGPKGKVQGWTLQSTPTAVREPQVYLLQLDKIARRATYPPISNRTSCSMSSTEMSFRHKSRNFPAASFTNIPLE